MTTLLEEARLAANKRRGFASMTREENRRISSMGGKASQASGKGHKFTSEEAQAAGRKGGSMSRRRSRWAIEEAKQYV